MAPMAIGATGGGSCTSYTKAPYHPSGRRAATTKPQTWSTFGDAFRAYNTGKFDGMGFVLTKEAGLIGFDFDDCVTDGVVEPWAQALVDELHSYTEFSPSGEGLHVIVRGKIPEDGRTVTLDDSGSKIEVYSAKRYLTVTGRSLQGCTQIESQQERIDKIWQQLFATTKPHGGVSTAPQKAASDDDKLLAKARQAKDGEKFTKLFDHGDLSDYKNDHSAADKALCNMLAFWTGHNAQQMDRLFRLSALMRPKWDEKRGAGTYGSNEIAESIAYVKTIARKSYTLTDAGNAQRFADQHGHNLRYCHSTGRWLIWNNATWREDTTEEVFRLAKETAKSLYEDIKAAKDEDAQKAIRKHAARSESANSLRSMLQLAQSEPKIPVRREELNTDPWLLTVENGTLDLQDGHLREHRREDLITHRLPIVYDPEAPAPLWKTFLNEITNSNPELAGFLQRLTGYTLTGSVREQAFFILHGSGANGKSVFLSTLQCLLGPYAWTASPELLLVRSQSLHATTRAALSGKRLVVATETKAGRQLDTGIVKWLTGGDPISANFMHQDEFVFHPTHKLFLATNELPRVAEADYGMWRRIYLIPFLVTFHADQQDKNLGEKLKGELPGILAWAVHGCMEWQRDGLQPPQEVLGATRQYQDDENQVKRFLEECCVQDSAERVGSTELYKAYVQWYTASGETDHVTQNMLGRKITALGYNAIKSSGTKSWKGLGLKGGFNPS